MEENGEVLILVSVPSIVNHKSSMF
jgi:hypothetical protein